MTPLSFPDQTASSDPIDLTDPPDVTDPPEVTDPAGAAGEPPLDESAATRHLCAAAYLDEHFREECLREVYYQSNRVVAPSYGFTLLPVLGHCLRARNMLIARDGAVVGMLLAGAFLAFPTFVWFAPVLVLVAVAVALGRVVRNTVRRVRSNFSLTPLASELMRLLALIAAGTAVMLVLAYVVYTSLPAIFRGAVGPGPRQLLETALSIPADLLVCALAVAPIIGHRLWQQRQLSLLGPGRRVGHPRPSRRLEDIRRQQRGNTVIYSNRNPFIGSGTLIHKGSLAARLVPDSNHSGPLRDNATRVFDKTPFTAEELIDEISDRMQGLATDPDSERRIPALRVESLVFRAGTEAGKLSTVTGPTALAEIIRCPTEPARHYLVCQVVSWEGELVTTVYVYFAVQGQSLYLQMQTTALPPCDARYRVADLVDGTGPIAYLRAVGRSIVEAPRVAMAAPLGLILAMADLLTATMTRTAHSSASATDGFDYGARVSVRELGASEMLRDPMQGLDVDKYAQIIQRWVVNSMRDFLKARGVDPTELDGKADNYFNNFNNYFIGPTQTGGGATMQVGAIEMQGNSPLGPPPGAGFVPPAGATS
jgi:hypothetical protein